MAEIPHEDSLGRSSSTQICIQNPDAATATPLSTSKKTDALFHLAQPKTQMRQLRLQQTRSKTQMRSVTPTPRRLGPMTQRHDAARRSRFDGANEEADGNTDATTRRRDDGANAEADGTNDGTRRCGAA